MMSAPTLVSTPVEIPPEVASFLEKKGVSEHLGTVLEITARAYPGCPSKLEYRYDYEDPDWQYVVIETAMGEHTTEEYMAAMDAWGTEFIALIPPHARQYFINGAR